MAARSLLHDRPIGGVRQKNGQGEKRNRRVLGDIGNVVTVRGGVAGNRIAKPTVVNRPLTRKFSAPLHGSTQKREGQFVEDKNAAGVRRGVVLEKVSEKQKLQQEQDPRKQKPATLTCLLTARSKEASGLSTKAEGLVVNIDEDSIEDELAVVEYVEDICQFYKLSENESRLHDYMGKQLDINEMMRSILVDWLIEVHHKFELRQETLYLTINIIDRFLSMKVIPRKELQLVGLASMLIACKYEEIWAPEANDFVQISDKAYVKDELLAMEKAILGKLEWYLTVPTPYMFLTRYVKASILADSEIEKMVYFFAELGIMSYSTVIKYPPSLLAAASVYCARLTLSNHHSWTETLRYYTGYSQEQLRDCARLLLSFHSGAPEHRLKAVYKKYARPELGSVSLRPPAKALLA